MSGQDYGEMLDRAISLVKEMYINDEQPWEWPRRELHVKDGHVPDAIFVHAEEPMSGKIDLGDVLIHAICTCQESCALCNVEEDTISFPMLDDMEDTPANYLWLVIPEDLDIEEDVLNILEGECAQRGIGLIICYSDKDYDEICVDPELIEGQFLTVYTDWHGIFKSLLEQVPDLLDFESYGESEDEYHYQRSDWDSSGDYD